MTTLTVTETRANLYKLIDDTSVNYEPVIITGKLSNAVLLAEGDWNAVTGMLSPKLCTSHQCQECETQFWPACRKALTALLLN